MMINAVRTNHFQEHGLFLDFPQIPSQACSHLRNQKQEYLSQPTPSLCYWEKMSKVKFWLETQSYVRTWSQTRTDCVFAALSSELSVSLSKALKPMKFISLQKHIIAIYELIINHTITVSFSGPVWLYVYFMP